jgi:lantibiotic biosynthesis protein
VNSLGEETRKISAKRDERGRTLYEALSWALVRAPILPVETYLGLSDPISPDGPLLADPTVRAALAVGSGNLFDALGRAGPSGREEPKTTGKLLRYLIRMSSRPTPYGLFAGVGLSGWGRETDLSILPGRPRTRTRPDMAWLLRLVFEAEGRREVRSHLRYLANPQAFFRGGRVFLPESAPMTDAGGAGPAVSIRATNTVTRAMALARTPVPHSRLVAALVETTGAPVEKVEHLIDELWRQTLLLTDLRPPLTVARPAEYVADCLRDIPSASDSLRQLEQALGAMAAWDALPIDQAASAYRKLAIDPDEEDQPASKVSCQVDMALTLGGSRVCNRVAKEAAQAAELLLRLTPLSAGLPHLEAYRRAFEARYGSDREVPLLELLDANFGLGPPSGFAAGAAVGDPRKAALRQRTLYDLGITAFRERKLIVNLTKKELAALETWTPNAATAPRSLDLSVFVMAASAADVDSGRFQIVIGPNLGATAAGRNLGRFADLLGQDAAAALRELGRVEAALEPECLSAEVVYLPRRFRSGNVAVRPHPRSYEIALGTTPGRPIDQVIPLDELVVGTRDGRFYVRWTLRDSDIVPYVGHMLNNMQAPDVCRFLDDLGRDSRAQIGSFDWGPASGLPFLPRVQVGRIVLCPAQWRVDARARDALVTDAPASGFLTALREWRAYWTVPRYVYISFGDNRLLLDLDSAAHAEELRVEVHRLADGRQLLLQEALPGPHDAWAEGPRGHFITELVIPLALRPGAVSPSARKSRPRPHVVVASSERLRPPGSDWLFAKLYGPRAFEDDLLTGPVLEVCQQAITSGRAESWFFIRYADPEPHLRLRFRGDPGRLLKELVPHLSNWASGLLNDGLIVRLCFDTYEREVERFAGPAGVEAAEALFHTDSHAVIEILRLSRSGLLDLDLSSLAFVSIDDLLAGLGATEAERAVWYRERAPSRTLAADEYRRRKDTLRRLIGDPEELFARPGGDALARIFAARRNEIARIVDQLDGLASAGELLQPKSALFRSYVHLHCNRLLAGDRFAEERVLTLLARARDSLRRAPYGIETHHD